MILNSNINTKINFFGLVILFSFISFFMIFNFFQSRISSDESLIYNYNKFSQIIASQSNLYILSNDIADLSFVEEFKQNFQNIKGHAIFSENTILYDNLEKGYEWPTDLKYLNTKSGNEHNGIVYRSNNNLVIKYDVYTYEDDFLNNNEKNKNIIGNSFILIDLNVNQKTETSYFILILSFIVLFSIFWFFFNIFIKNNIVSPVKEISDAMDVASRGIYLPVKTETTNQETLTITNSFNTLLKSIQQKDISQKKLIEKEEFDSLEKIDFLFNIGNQIKTPLSSVLSTLNYIDTSNFNDIQKNELGKSISLLSELENTSEDFISFSKYSFNDIDFNETTCNLCNLLNISLSKFHNEIKRKDLKVQINYDKNLPIFFELDEIKIKEMFSVFISNAVKFTENGSISIDVDYESSVGKTCKLLIKIKDTGIGISNEKFNFIFEPYKKIKGNSIENSGNGLGLFIANKIVTSLGGFVEIESKLGSGSTFIVSLELKTSEKIVDSVTFSKKGVKAISEHKKIAAIISDNTYFYFIQKLFDYYQVDFFNDVNKFKNNEYDLIITDQNINKLNLTADVIQLNKEFFDDFKLNLEFPFDKNNLDLYLDRFINHNTKIVENIDEIDNLFKRLSTVKTTGDLSILVFDNNTVNQFNISKELRKTGNHNIKFSKTQDDTVSLFKKFNFDVIFINCNMSCVDSYETTLKIRNIEKEMMYEKCNIIAITSSESNQVIEKSKISGMDYFIRKPINMTKIKNVFEFIKDKNNNNFIINEKFN